MKSITFRQTNKRGLLTLTYEYESEVEIAKEEACTKFSHKIMMYNINKYVVYNA